MNGMKTNRGFTLVELLVALVIISVGLLALGAFTIGVLKSDKVAQQRTVAVHLAEQELEKWYQSGVAPAASTSFTVNGAVYKLETFGGTPSSGVWTSALGGATGADARAITVYWQSKGRTRSVTVQHMQRMQ